MLDTINNQIVNSTNSSKFSNFRDEILTEYYSQYFNALSSKEFDKEFNRDLSVLVKSLIDTLNFIYEIYFLAL